MEDRQEWVRAVSDEVLLKRFSACCEGEMGGGWGELQTWHGALSIFFCNRVGVRVYLHDLTSLAPLIWGGLPEVLHVDPQLANFFLADDDYIV